MENTNNTNNALNGNQNANSDNNGNKLLYNLLPPSEFFNIPEDVRNNLPQSSIEDWKANARAYGFDPNIIHNNMNGMMDFLFENSSSIRIIVNGPTPDYTLFCGPDIANVLGYADRADHMYRILPDYEKVDIDVANLIPHNSGDQVSQHGGLRHMIFITLPGLFRVINSSRKPEAIRFQNWVYHEVLPNLFNYGYYATPDTRMMLEHSPNIVHDLNNKISELEARNKDLNDQVAELTPLANTGRAIEIDDADTTLNILCKIIQNNLSFSFGLHDMMAHLRFDGFLIRDTIDYNMPTQKSLNMGLLKAAYNQAIDRYVVMVTPSGVNYFVNYFMKKLSNK